VRVFRTLLGQAVQVGNAVLCVVPFAFVRIEALALRRVSRVGRTRISRKSPRATATRMTNPPLGPVREPTRSGRGPCDKTPPTTAST
jgi:hypothetical protein